MHFDDDWFERMPWVPAMPGNKAYVLQEAQKEIERLRQEIKRLRSENQELRAAVGEVKQEQANEDTRESSKGVADGGASGLGIGDYLVVVGVVKVMEKSQDRKK